MYLLKFHVLNYLPLLGDFIASKYARKVIEIGQLHALKLMLIMIF